MLEDGRTIALPVARRHVELWRTETMPVILIMYDMAAERAYWLYVQHHLRTTRQTWPAAQKEVSLRMSMSNIVDENAIEQFRQFKAEALRQIEEETNVDQSCCPSARPSGRLSEILIRLGFVRRDTAEYIAFKNPAYDALIAFPVIQPQTPVRPGPVGSAGNRHGEWCHYESTVGRIIASGVMEDARSLAGKRQSRKAKQHKGEEASGNTNISRQARRGMSLPACFSLFNFVVVLTP